MSIGQYGWAPVTPPGPTTTEQIDNFINHPVANQTLTFGDLAISNNGVKNTNAAAVRANHQFVADFVYVARPQPEARDGGDAGAAQADPMDLGH